MALVGAAMAACAGIGLREPLRVSLAGLESLSGEGVEARFLARIRVQNPNDVAIAYSGASDRHRAPSSGVHLRCSQHGYLSPSLIPQRRHLGARAIQLDRGDRAAHVGTVRQLRLLSLQRKQFIDSAYTERSTRSWRWARSRAPRRPDLAPVAAHMLPAPPPEKMQAPSFHEPIAR